MADLSTEVLERKLSFLRQFLTDLASYAALALYRDYLDWALNETAGWK